MRSVILEEEFAGKQSSEVDICGFCNAAGLCGRCSGACAAVVFSLRDGIFYTLKENFISQRPGHTAQGERKQHSSRKKAPPRPNSAENGLQSADEGGKCKKSG